MRHFAKYKWLMAIMTGMAVGVCDISTMAQEPATTTASATMSAAKPAGFTIAGHVALPTGWKLEKPDLTHIVIYLASSPALDAIAPPAEPAIMAQHNKAFEPNFIVIARNSTVEFPNWDHFNHNVFSRSKAAPAFDLSRYKFGQSKSRTFDKVGIIQLFCNIHPEMRAMIFVTPNAYFARADAAGHFALRDVPPGQYDLVVWNERCQELHQPVQVANAAPPELALTLQEDRKSILANDPPQPRNTYSVEKGLNVKREALNLPVVPNEHPAPVPPPADRNP